MRGLFEALFLMARALVVLVLMLYGSIGIVWVLYQVGVLP